MAQHIAPAKHRVGDTYRVRGLTLTEHFFEVRCRASVACVVVRALLPALSTK
jgi:hypothetical protein